MKLIESSAGRQRDDQAFLVRMLRKCACPGDGYPMRTALRNESGDICLVIETASVREFSRVFDFLATAAFLTN